MCDEHLDNPIRCTFSSGSEQDTDRLGALLADVLRGGDIVALNGELGAGKTRLVRAIVRSLCPADQQVSSPTYVLVQQYEGETPVFHFDAYRLADADEFLELGAEEIFGDGGICLIEWAERVADALPPASLRIDIQVTGPQSREYQLSGQDGRSIEMIEAIQARSHGRS